MRPQALHLVKTRETQQFASGQLAGLFARSGRTEARRYRRQPFEEGLSGENILHLQDGGPRDKESAHDRCSGDGLPPTVGFVNHDYTRFTSPAYSFHQRLNNSIHLKDSSPGPCYYVEPELTRFGRARGPSYSILARAKPQGKLEVRTPGPATYSPERVPPPAQQRPPSYSIGARTKYRLVDPVPAPNSYTLPSLLGPRVPSKPSSPSFTITGWNARGSYSEDLRQTPGPGCYKTTDPNVYLCRSPAFSMLGRFKKPTSTFCTPGPGAHSPEKVTVHRTGAPSYSLGIRHSDFLMPLILDAPPKW
ncbi:hypothetical protein JD844_034097 [Phrynosoma platyrhinos]|uniref:Outer dense fiber protein 3-like protein 2 n=1 Tax=Phrynosoma platyrhinos TaxID=52577 RepID=A0ABQ7T7W4_PHRPL|nr:hypothetical protein JD844_034097 [Phrynosoma platyrhinos]